MIAAHDIAETGLSAADTPGGAKYCSPLTRTELSMAALLDPSNATTAAG
jgi:hypothetical protein